MAVIRKITLGDLFHIYWKKKMFFRVNKNYSFLYHDNGVKAYILVGYKNLKSHFGGRLPNDVKDFWVLPSYEIIDIYSNEQYSENIAALEDTFDVLFQSMKFGDILWAKEVSNITNAYLHKRLGFAFFEKYKLFIHQKS